MTKPLQQSFAARQCRRLLDLTDLIGQEKAFATIQDEIPIDREWLVRMLKAARGATTAELFSIAAAIAVARGAVT